MALVKVIKPDLSATVLDHPLHLLMDQLHTSQAWFLQPSDLSLHQQLKGNLWYKQGRPSTLACDERVDQLS